MFQTSFLVGVPNSFRYKIIFWKRRKNVNNYICQKWLDAIYRQMQLVSSILSKSWKMESAPTPQPGSMNESESWRDPCSLPNTSLRFRPCQKHSTSTEPQVEKTIILSPWRWYKKPALTISFFVNSSEIHFLQSCGMTRHDSSQNQATEAKPKSSIFVHLLNGILCLWFLCVSTASVTSSAINHIQKNTSFKHGTAWFWGSSFALSQMWLANSSSLRTWGNFMALLSVIIELHSLKLSPWK